MRPTPWFGAPQALVLLGALITAAPASAQHTRDSLIILQPEAMTGWQTGRTRGVEYLNLYRSPADSGPFVARTRFQPGRGLGPHYHARGTTITVIEGRFRLGIGEQVDSSTARAYPPGSFLVIPAGVAHFEWGEGETIIQLSGSGPLGFTRVAPSK